MHTVAGYYKVSWVCGFVSTSNSLIKISLIDAKNSLAFSDSFNLVDVHLLFDDVTFIPIAHLNALWFIIQARNCR